MRHPLHPEYDGRPNPGQGATEQRGGGPDHDLKRSNRPPYRERADPRLAPERLLVFAFTRGPLIEFAPGSNWPGRIFFTGTSTSASRFLARCADFAFARLRAFSLVISIFSSQIDL
jgi:hypothetical protein